MIPNQKIPCFEAGMQFTLGGQHYIMQGCIEPDLGLDSTEIECYIVKSVESNEKRCLRTMRNLKSKKSNEGYDFINKESQVLDAIQSQPGALKYFGKANVMDLNSYLRSCIIVELPICSLSNLFDGHLDSISLAERIQIAVSAIQAYSVFINSNIIWSEEITFNSLIVVERNKLAILSGLSTCEVLEKSNIRSSLELGYTFKKNCAQIKAIAMGILLNDKDLASKHATPYNLQQFIGRVISKNKDITKLAQGYSDYPKIFSCFGLEELDRFFDFASSQYAQFNQAENSLQRREEIVSQQSKQDAIEIITYRPENTHSKDSTSNVAEQQVSLNNSDQKQLKSQTKAERLSIIQGELEDHVQQESKNEDYFAITNSPQKQLLNQEMKKYNNNNNPQDASLNLINVTTDYQAGLHQTARTNEPIKREQPYKEEIGIQQVTSNTIHESNSISNNKNDQNNIYGQENKLKNNNSISNNNIPINNNNNQSTPDNDMEGKLAEQSNQLKLQQAQLEQLMKMLQKREQEEKDKEQKVQKVKISTKKIPGKTSSHIETLKEEPEEEEKDEQEDGDDDNGDIESQHDTSRNTILKKFQQKSTKNSSTNQLKDKSTIYDPSFTENSIMQSEESAHGNNSHNLDENKQGSSSMMKKETKEEDQIGSSGSNGVTRGLNDNLLGLAGGKIPTLEQFQSDRKTVRVLGGLLVVFVIFCIIFGVAFNFGVNKPDSEKIICDDTNCATCEEFADTCSACKSDYYLSSTTGACVHECTVSNCQTCISDYTVCEACEDGYVLALSSCYVAALSCTTSNCKECKDLVCIECDFGYKLSSGTCIKKCLQSICATCNLSDVSICLACTSPYTLNTSTNQCQ